MEVELLNFTPLWVCSNAIRTCWQSFDKGDNGGEKDVELIDRVGNKFKHASTLEHLYYNFYIKGISRALLQELARHRIASLSVKSTRYTLKELKNESEFRVGDFENASTYIVLTGNKFVDNASINALENLRRILNQNTSLDIAKYCLPESYKTELSWSINARSLQNFLSLRSSKQALWEIRDLANLIYQNIPDGHKFIYENCLIKSE
ncbi:FAD-dependent thymidylate synthase [Campylobacter fetus]|uniref:FAD-dependent thymidylate synthase n=1 Tax=Campylobacter fetus TaxID=196 RepID=UPI000FCC4E5F|nr:FAD-dependent thymidylate synthase [Campylobacter fetus]QQF52515.1 FAD-dependent thymidylate synthase [Campylobacter fetus subsp. venerealis]RUT49340.1 thymidylate synthase (FAD) [Campylobacter fetus]RUT49599.1 thymidylate synthase (FAD) [Campylobacter fetus]